MSNTHSHRPATSWFKSSFSNPSQECVEVCFGTDLVHIRDSKDCGTGPVVTIGAADWPRFLDEAAGRAPADPNTVITIVVGADGGARLHAQSNPSGCLSYTSGEWSAFVAGICNAEFDLPNAETIAA